MRWSVYLALLMAIERCWSNQKRALGTLLHKQSKCAISMTSHSPQQRSQFSTPSTQHSTLMDLIHLMVAPIVLMLVSAPLQVGSY